MKGPDERLKYDLRRLWECPVCKRRERTAGSVTFRHCNCQMQKLDGKPIVMKLVEDGVQRLLPAIKPPALVPEGQPASAFEKPAPLPDPAVIQELSDPASES